MKKWLKITIVSVLTLAIVAVGGFFVYVSDYYRADTIAVSVLATDEAIHKDGDNIVFTPDTPSDTALIFYPGGKVEYIAYVPLMERLRQNGITCVLVKMPYNLAVLDINAADRIYSLLPNIKSWYIGGHSLGGAMASSYAASHKDKIKGLVLLGAYIYGDVDPKNALTIYGSEDIQLDLTKITYTQNVHKIEGGNHAQFGNYGEQKGDGKATMSREQQQQTAVGIIVAFMEQ